MTSYLVIAIVVGLILGAVAFFAKVIGDEEKCRTSSCTRGSLNSFLTNDTPVVLSVQEVDQGGLRDFINEYSANPKSVVVNGVEGIEVTLPEALNILTQKLIQHEQEIGDIVTVLPKKTRKATSKKKTSSKKK